MLRRLGFNSRTMRAAEIVGPRECVYVPNDQSCNYIFTGRSDIGREIISVRRATMGDGACRGGTKGGFNQHTS